MQTSPHLRNFTIAEYAHYVLDDPRIKEVIEKFELYRAVADKMIDAFDFLLDEGLLKFDTPEELSVARAFNKTGEETKRHGLEKIVNDIYHMELPLGLRTIMMRDESEQHPNRSDMPLIMFKAFATDPLFSEYLYTGQLSLINGVYFTKDLDLARQKYLIFALYIWSLYDAEKVSPRSSEIYFDKAAHSISPGYSYLPIDTDFNERNLSTVEERLTFLRLFKDYIHFDLWESGDYAKRAKTGIVLRLRFSTVQTGQVVVQECGTGTSSCNTVYRVTLETLDLFRRKYLTQENPLEKLGHFFPCATCGSPLASLVFPSDTETRFYCRQECFIRRQRESL